MTTGLPRCLDCRQPIRGLRWLAVPGRRDGGYYCPSCWAKRTRATETNTEREEFTP